MGVAIFAARDVAGERGTRPWPAIRRIAEDSLTPLAYLILPNVPLLLLRQKMTLMPHGIINLECLLLGICSLFIPRSLVFGLLALEIAGGFAYEICYSFQFRLVDLLTAARSLPDLPARMKIEFAVALVLVLGVAALVAFGVPRPKRRLRTSLILLVMTILVAGVDFVDGANPYAKADVMTVAHRLSLAPWVTLGVRGEFQAMVNDKSNVARDTAPMDSASGFMLGQLQPMDAWRGSSRPNVVLVLVESWGLLTDGSIAKELAAPYDDPQLLAAYDLSSGTTAFDGLTVPGEVRELCQSHVGFGILQVKGAQGQSCLPDEFKALGYETDAVHGYAGGVFQRNSWYRKLGFERMWFRPELQQQGLPMCPGVYPGICDSAIAQWIGKHVLSQANQKPQFVHWVTLNSHIPVPLHPQLPADTLCSSAAALKSSEALCSWFRIVHEVHASVAQLADEEVARPTIFVVVGDHSPPFASPLLRQEFSQTVVPYVVLIPKALRSSATHGADTHQIAAGAQRAGRERAAQQHKDESSSGN